MKNLHGNDQFHNLHKLFCEYSSNRPKKAGPGLINLYAENVAYLESSKPPKPRWTQFTVFKWCFTTAVTSQAFDLSPKCCLLNVSTKSECDWVNTECHARFEYPRIWGHYIYTTSCQQHLKRPAPLSGPVFIVGCFGAILVSQSATLSKETRLALIVAERFLDPTRYASISSEVSQRM